MKYFITILMCVLFIFILTPAEANNTVGVFQEFFEFPLVSYNNIIGLDNIKNMEMAQGYYRPYPRHNLRYNRYHKPYPKYRRVPVPIYRPRYIPRQHRGCFIDSLIH